MLNARAPMAALLALVLAQGCASVPGEPVRDSGESVEIRGLVIQNRAYATLTEVILLVVPTREFVSCGNIPMRGQCSTTFPLREYRGNQIEISWKEGGREWTTGEFRIERQTERDQSRPVLVRVIISPAGKAVTDLVE